MNVSINFSQPADVVAPKLLGCVITMHGVSIRLTEVEAYIGAEDPAAHHHTVAQRNVGLRVIGDVDVHRVLIAEVITCCSLMSPSVPHHTRYPQ